MKLSTEHNRKSAGPRRALAGSALALLVLAGIGLQSQAQAVAEEGAGIYTTSFSALRDPQSFADDLMVVMPSPVIPMTQADAVARELRLRSKTLTEVEVQQVAGALVEETKYLDYDPLLILALIRVESDFNHLAISPVGAEGLMQLMPPTAAWMADKVGIEWPDGHSFDPVLNVRLGTRYYAYLDRQFHGSTKQALTAYNRGPSATRFLMNRHGELPAEIRDFYAEKVLECYRDFRDIYGHLPAS